MVFSGKEKTKLINSYKRHEGDTGSSEVQVAILTKRMNELVEHLKTHKKDHSSRRGLILLVGQRKRLMSYLERTDIKRYENLTASLKIK